MAVLQTYQVTTQKDDLTDVITNITPDDTPLLSSLKGTKMYSLPHQVQVDDLDTPTDNSNKWVQGADAVEEDQGMPERVLAWPQIFRKHPKVAGTAQAVKIVGIKNAYSYQVTKKTKELALAIEFALINATGNSGNSTTPTEINGVLSSITTNVRSGEGEGETLTEDMYNDLMQDIWSNGTKAKVTYCTGSLKRAISGFTGGTVKNLPARDKKLVTSVDVYEGDFGTQRIIPHRLLPLKTLVAMSEELWAIAWLRKTKHEPLAKVGDAVRGMIVAELALEARQEKGSGKYLNVTV